MLSLTGKRTEIMVFKHHSATVVSKLPGNANKCRLMQHLYRRQQTALDRVHYGTQASMDQHGKETIKIKIY